MKSGIEADLSKRLYTGVRCAAVRYNSARFDLVAHVGCQNVFVYEMASSGGIRSPDVREHFCERGANLSMNPTNRQCLSLPSNLGYFGAVSVCVGRIIGMLNGVDIDGK